MARAFLDTMTYDADGYLPRIIPYGLIAYFLFSIVINDAAFLFAILDSGTVLRISVFKYPL